MHIAASNTLSVDPRQATTSPLASTIELLATNLAHRNYVGQLCGCWLEILVLIPQIRRLGLGFTAPGVEGHGWSSPDDMITFGFLQSQIMSFSPNESVSTDTKMAGLVWKQAALLYLWTTLGLPLTMEEGTMVKGLIDAAVSDGISSLNCLPATVRVNTSLCWPLAVLGCCTADTAIQEILRSRLNTMQEIIGLGNMKQTLLLLEHVWRQPFEETSPWLLWRTMKEHQIWISFA